MKRLVTIREFARLTTEEVVPSLDQVTLPTSSFDWLCEMRSNFQSNGADLIHLPDRRSLRLDNYVGVIECPCGTQIEILPKALDGADEIPGMRRVLRRMLANSLDLSFREFPDADIDAFEGPLTEWVAARFLRELDRLIKRGIRFDYQRIDEEQRFQRGRLDIVRQLRQPPGRRHLFHIQHDVFEPDRPENRVIRSVLETVRSFTQSSMSWRLAHELTSILGSIPLSANTSQDFRAWHKDRLMAHYEPIKPWCSLILNEQTPKSMAGGWRGPSLLFPMEKLFERYVASYLRDTLLPDGRLTCAPRQEWLCRHREADWFRLEPDFLIHFGSKRWVLDAKWKRLDGALGGASEKYGLSQDDLYQMFAYGHKYLKGEGDMVLIYPLTNSFRGGLEPFQFSDALRLWVVPFDLQSGRLAEQMVDLPLRQGG
jgi:5-methylcytosine-specific restriction enzyme subunit McrC